MAQNQTATSPQDLTLKWLTGMLRGVEFSLSAERTVLIVGDAASDLPDAATRADECLYIPAATIGPHFAIQQPGLAADFSIEYLDAGVPSEAGYFQRPCTVGNLVFALKPSGAVWSDAVQQYADQPPDSIRTSLVSSTRPGGWGKTLLALLFLALLLVAAWFAWPKVRGGQSEQQGRLISLLQAPNHRFTTRLGRDRVLYVLAENEVGAAWAQQQLTRAGFSREVQVLSVPQEQARLGRWLEARQLPYFVLQLSSLAMPTLILSQERALSEAEFTRSVLPDLLATMPYAEKLNLRRQSDAVVQTQAQTLLRRLGLSYRQEGDRAHGLVYLLQGEIDDGTLSQLRQQITSFEQAYGERYVRFVLQQREDWLKGKSYKYGANGYVLQSARHWYFLQPL